MLVGLHARLFRRRQGTSGWHDGMEGNGPIVSKALCAGFVLENGIDKDWQDLTRE